MAKAQKKQDQISNILNERGSRYGSFVNHANITMTLKLSIHQHLKDHGKEDVITADMVEALDMICHKIGRIVNGDPTYADSWIDIAGYAKLVSDRLQLEESSNESAK
jgi:hypothetical protein